MKHLPRRTVAVIVAHPDDETLWAGGTILSHPAWIWFIVCLCRKNDPERAPRFEKVLSELKSEGIMGDMEDGPDQVPIPERETESAILDLLPLRHFDLVITHNVNGEYTRHIRHEEISKAVLRLWSAGKISATELWTFAYEDGNRQYYPRAIEDAPLNRLLTRRIWLKKESLILNTYGYSSGSWEAETIPKSEAFWQFTNSYDAIKWIKSGGKPT